jgi:hypothetical protein
MQAGECGLGLIDQHLGVRYRGPWSVAVLWIRGNPCHPRLENFGLLRSLFLGRSDEVCDKVRN